MPFANGESFHQEGSYRITVGARPGFEGQPVVCDLSCDESRVSWFFIRSQNNFDGDRAVVTVRKDADCCGCLEDVKPWRDEVQFWRLGENSTQADYLAWAGSIEDKIDSPGSQALILICRVRGAQIFSGLIPTTEGQSFFPPRNALFVAQDLIEDAFSQQDFGLTLRTVAGGSFVPADFEEILINRPIGPILDRIARSGVDIAVCGTELIIGDLRQFSDDAQLPVLSPELHWGQPTPDLLDAGSQAATVVTVLGADGVEGTFPVNPVPDPEAGILHRFIEDSEVTGPGEATIVARSEYLSSQYGENFWLATSDSNGSINCNFPVPLSELCPGNYYRLATNADRGVYCTTIIQTVRLRGVRVDGVGCRELTTKLVLEPVGVAEEAT